MATLAANWYDRSGNIVIRQDITEVAVVSSYAPKGNEVVSWDASSALDGSVMAYITGTKLTLVCDSLTEIPAQMFFQFLSMETISGLSAVTIIGERAFCYTPKISVIDIDPTKLTSIGAYAFRMSSAEDNLDLSSVSLDIVGDMATRHKRWSAEKLSAIKSVAFPRTICLDVPNSENQENYPDVPYYTLNGEVKMVSTSGCTGLACYHIWNAINAGTDKEYGSFIDWYNATLNRNGDWAEIFTRSFNQLTNALGWTDVEQIYANDGTTALNAILAKLNHGLPVFAQIWSTNAPEGQHNLCFVGCDANTRKIAVMDSSVFGTTGVLSWLAFEDIYNDGNDTDRVIIVGYNQPVMASDGSWFTQGGVTSATRKTITEIDILDEYAPTGNESASWDASAEKDGCVTAYIEGTRLTIAGNGYGHIYAHPDSTSAFSDPNSSNPFSAVTAIRGLDILNTRRTQTLKRVFNGCNSLESVDVSNWDTSACTNMTAMFQNCYNLKTLDLSKWNVSNVTEMNAMFQSSVNGTYMRLESIGNVGNWDTSCVTGMQQMFKDCAYLKELNVRNWDTSKVTLRGIFIRNAYRLKKFTVGEKFDITDLMLPAPSTEYHILADGNWYDSDHNAYDSIPINVERTYYASKFIAVGDDDALVFVRNGTLKQMAFSIRHKSGKSETMLPSKFAEEVLALE